ncbi:unnamed protein product [Moneuplotes crassus]|uniref:Uncharacterized protein n=1 Tax=Euplotes crassus TaxID=5936 RepID=A0AAD1Y547_EUPCR|nr:unnamed protein product [Moneuplotes crassus]
MFYSSDSSAEGNKERKYWKYIQEHNNADTSSEKLDPEIISSFLNNSNNYKSVDFTNSHSADMIIKEIAKSFLAQKEVLPDKSFFSPEKDQSLLSRRELEIFDNSIQMNSSMKINKEDGKDNKSSFSASKISRNKPTDYIEDTDSKITKKPRKSKKDIQNNFLKDLITHKRKNQEASGKVPSLDKPDQKQTTTHQLVKNMFNKTLDINNHLQNDISQGLDTEKYQASQACSGCETKKRNSKPTHSKSRRSMESRLLNVNSSKLKVKNFSSKKSTQARSYIKDGKMLSTYKHMNTKSTGMIQPFSEVIYEGNESCELSNSKNSLYSSNIPRFGNNTTNRKIGSNKAVTKFRNDYLKKKRRMKTLNSTHSLKKSASSSKSFSSLNSKQVYMSKNVEKDQKNNSGIASIGNEKGIRKCEIKLINKSDEGAVGTNFSSRTSCLQRYRSQSHLPSTECFSKTESQILHDEIQNLEVKISVLEGKLCQEQKNSIIKQEKMKEEFQAQLSKKDQELKVSRDQISQLLRIIEQMTNSQKLRSGQSKISESNETQCIKVKENFEVSSSDLTNKQVDINSDGTYYIKEGNYGNIKLKELDCGSYDSDKMSIPGPSPTLSNISEGIAGIYSLNVNEVQRNIVKTSENLFGHPRNSMSKKFVYEGNDMKKKAQERISVTARPSIDENEPGNSILKKLESLRTPSSKIFKKILKDESKLEYKEKIFEDSSDESKNQAQALPSSTCLSTQFMKKSSYPLSREQSVSSTKPVFGKIPRQKVINLDDLS